MQPTNPMGPGPESRLLKPLKHWWHYQRDDADTIFHYKFTSPGLPILDSSGHGNDMDQPLYDPNAAPGTVTWQAEGPPGMDYALDLAPDCTSPYANTGAAQFAFYSAQQGDHITMGATDNWVIVAVVRLKGTAPMVPVDKTIIEAAFPMIYFPSWLLMGMDWNYRIYDAGPPPSYYYWNFATLRLDADEDLKQNWVQFPAGTVPIDPTPAIPVNVWSEVVMIGNRSQDYMQLKVNGALQANFSDYGINHLHEIGEFHVTNGTGGIIVSAAEMGDWSMLPYQHLGYNFQIAELWMSKGLTYTSHF